MEHHFLNFVMLNGKCTIEFARNTILKLANKSKIYRKLNKMYKRKTSMVGMGENMLEVINHRQSNIETIMCKSEDLSRTPTVLNLPMSSITLEKVPPVANVKVNLLDLFYAEDSYSKEKLILHKTKSQGFKTGFKKRKISINFRKHRQREKLFQTTNIIDKLINAPLEYMCKNFSNVTKNCRTPTKDTLELSANCMPSHGITEKKYITDSSALIANPNDTTSSEANKSPETNKTIILQTTGSNVTSEDSKLETTPKDSVTSKCSKGIIRFACKKDVQFPIDSNDWDAINADHFHQHARVSDNKTKQKAEDQREGTTTHAFCKPPGCSITLCKEASDNADKVKLHFLFNFDNQSDFNRMVKLITNHLALPLDLKSNNMFIPYHPDTLLFIETYFKKIQTNGKVIILKKEVKPICQQSVDKYKLDYCCENNFNAMDEQRNIEKVQLKNQLAFNKLERRVTQALLLKNAEDATEVTTKVDPSTDITVATEVEPKLHNPVLTVGNALDDFNITKVPCRLFTEPIVEDGYINNISTLSQFNILTKPCARCKISGFTNNSIFFKKESFMFTLGFIRKQLYSTQQSDSNQNIQSIVHKQKPIVSQTALVPFNTTLNQLIIYSSVIKQLLQTEEKDEHITNDANPSNLSMDEMMEPIEMNSSVSSQPHMDLNDIAERTKVLEQNKKMFDRIEHELKTVEILKKWSVSAIISTNNILYQTIVEKPLSCNTALVLINYSNAHDLIYVQPPQTALINKITKITELIPKVHENTAICIRTEEIKLKNKLTVQNINQQLNNEKLAYEENKNEIKQANILSVSELEMQEEKMRKASMEKELIKAELLAALSNLHFYIKLSSVVPLELFAQSQQTKEKKIQSTSAKKLSLTVMHNFKLAVNKVIQSLFSKSYTPFFNNLDIYRRLILQKKSKQLPKPKEKINLAPTVQENRATPIFLTNEIPLAFKKKLNVHAHILPQTTVWSCYPRTPTYMMVKNKNNNKSKQVKPIIRKYKYETKEVKASNGKTVRITCLIPTRDNE